MPDYQDLNAITGTTINDYGGLVLPEFGRYVAQAHTGEAFTLQQQRQWREEQVAFSRGRGRCHGSGDGGDGGSGGGGGLGGSRSWWQSWASTSPWRR